MVVSIGWWTKSLHGKLPGGFKYLLFSSRTLGKWSNLTNIFQMGWNHQLENGWKSPIIHKKCGSFGFQVQIGWKIVLVPMAFNHYSQWPVCRFVGLQSEAYLPYFHLVILVLYLYLSSIPPVAKGGFEWLPKMLPYWRFRMYITYIPRFCFFFLGFAQPTSFAWNCCRGNLCFWFVGCCLFQICPKLSLVLPIGSMGLVYLPTCKPSKSTIM